MEDPFILIKNEVVQSLTQASQLFESWKRIVQTVTSAENEELMKTKEELLVVIESIEQDLQDLEEAIRAVLDNPTRFSLTTRESNSRKQFVDQSRRRIQDMKNTVLKPVKIGADQLDRIALLEGPASSPRGYQKPSRRENTMYSNTKFVEQEAQQQQMLMREQDMQLDGVMETVVNMREIATTMGQELADQSLLLDDMDQHVDRTHNKLRSAMKKMNYIIQKNEERGASCCIGILIVILIVLLVMILLV